jgi:hypothetical protein
MYFLLLQDPGRGREKQVWFEFLYHVNDYLNILATSVLSVQRGWESEVPPRVSPSETERWI